MSASKIYFTITIPHKGPHTPQITLRTTNENGYQLGGYTIGNFSAGTDATKKFTRNRDRLEFNYNVSKMHTRLSLIVNTTKHIPHMTWSSNVNNNDEKKPKRAGEGRDRRRLEAKPRSSGKRHRSGSPKDEKEKRHRSRSSKDDKEKRHRSESPKDEDRRSRSSRSSSREERARPPRRRRRVRRVPEESYYI